jgi:NAD-dependent dihydropyrimidine dehydrogenase PreA subunit
LSIYLLKIKKIKKKCDFHFFEKENLITLLFLISTNQNSNKKMAYVISDDCIACGSCISECPVDAISEGDIYTIDADLCSDCGSCASVCPSEAISQA